MKELAGSIAIALSIIGYIPYLRDIIRGKTKPHVFSWVVWTLITVIIGFAQLAAGAGWGTVHNLVTGVIGLVIIYFALKNKQKDLSRTDIIFFVAALASIPLWIATKDPTYSVVLITVIDVMAFVPTFRKTWHDSTSETLSSYVIAGLKYCVAIVAIGTYGLATLLYPIVLIVMNIGLVAIILSRRRVLPIHRRHA